MRQYEFCSSLQKQPNSQVLGRAGASGRPSEIIKKRSNFSSLDNLKEDFFFNFFT